MHGALLVSQSLAVEPRSSPACSMDIAVAFARGLERRKPLMESLMARARIGPQLLHMQIARESRKRARRSRADWVDDVKRYRASGLKATASRGLLLEAELTSHAAPELTSQEFREIPGLSS
jgi:hypothetical protein